jgi:UMF1 family MFS transporter
MGIYLKEAGGFSDSSTVIGNISEITFYLIIVTIFTAAGSYIWGFINEKIGPKNSLRTTVVIWLITLSGIALFNNKAAFYLLGSLAGIALGGTWTSERPLLINLVGDDSKLAGYFGLFALCGRTAAVLGPLMWGIIVLSFDGFGVIKYRFAVGSLVLMMLAGFIILQRVPDVREKLS